MPVNDEKKQWHERPAILKSNLKSILVFVKQPPPPPQEIQYKIKHIFFT